MRKNLVFWALGAMLLASSLAIAGDMTKSKSAAAACPASCQPCECTGCGGC